MRLAFFAALVVAVLLSVVVSYYFHITFVALLTGLVFSFKQVKVIWVFEWLARFLLIRVPQRVLTALVKLYVIDRRTMTKVLELMKRYQEYLRRHHKTKLVIFGILALILMGVSAWWIGVWLLLIYEVEVLLLMVWRRIWPTVSETALMQAIARLFRLVAHTRLGQLVIRADRWLETHLRRSAEETGKMHKEQIRKALEEVLTSNLKGVPLPPPPPRETNRYDLRQSGHPRSASHREARLPPGGHRSPPPRPKRY